MPIIVNDYYDSAYLGPEIDAKLAMIGTNGTGGHNSMWGGRNLGTAVTVEQWNAINAGTFAGLYIGDYWIIGGIVWYIAAFDFYIGVGDNNTSTHHAVIVPQSPLYNEKMNASATTTSAYAGSAMRATNLDAAKTTINNAFGSSHILTHRNYFSSSASSGRPTGGAWYDSTVDLMTEQNVFGNKIYGLPNDGASGTIVSTADTRQFPLFQMYPAGTTVRQAYWLRDTASGTAFAQVSGYGIANKGNANTDSGVRPAFCIKG